MEVKGTHTYAASVDAVLAMLRDRDATVAKYEGMGHRDVEIVACDETDDGLHIESTRVVDVDLPGFAKKVLKPTNTMIVSTDQVAADAFGATLLGRTALELPYLQKAEAAGVGTTDFESLLPIRV